MLIMLGLVVLCVLVLGGYKAWTVYRQIQVFSAPKPPVSVPVTTAAQQAWQPLLPAVGSLKALQGVELSLEVAGTVRSLHFVSGQPVKAGQMLLQLDNQVEAAQLANAQADLGLAQVDYGRGRQLVDSQAISRGEFDRLAAQVEKNKANVAQLKAVLAKKSIVAPFAGTIGIRQVDVGDYLASGTVIATLQDIGSLYVDFYVPEQDVPRLALEQVVRIRVAAFADERFEGRISAINPKVEDSTRNVLVRATLPNPQAKLLPGMFGSLEVVLANARPVTVVPDSAVTYTLYGNSVYVVTAPAAQAGAQGSKPPIAQRRFIETGERRDGLVVVTRGIEAGDRVVSGGQLKLSDGAAIEPKADKTAPAVDTPGPRAD